MEPYEFGKENKFGFKIVFDLSFFILINTIILNIVFGIIIDTFNEMRDESFSRSAKLNSICLICQLSRQEIESKGVDFRKHTKTQHDYWLYISFLKYMDDKNVEDYTSDEVSVFLDLQRESTDWIPLKCSQYVGDIEEESTEIKEINEKVGNLESSMKELQSSMEEKFEKQESSMKEQQSSMKEQQSSMKEQQSNMKELQSILQEKLEKFEEMFKKLLPK